MSRKSYKALVDFSAENYNDIFTAYTKNDIVYMEEADAETFVDSGMVILTDDYLEVAEEQDLTGSGGDVTVTKAVYSVVAGTTIEVTLAVPAGSTTLMGAGSVLTMVIKDDEGATKETRTHTYAQIGKGASEVARFVNPSGLLAGDNLFFSLVAKDNASTYTFSATAELITPTTVGGVIFTVGASVASTNPIVTALQFLDSDGVAIAKRIVCEIFPLATFDTLDTMSACTVGTDGANIGTFGTNSSFMAISESDGDLDVTMTNASASRTRVACRLGDGKLFISDELIWS